LEAAVTLSRERISACDEQASVADGASQRTLRSESRTIELKPLYTAADVAGVAHLSSLPGHAPFVRGPYETMYTRKPWTIRQYAGYADAADSNLAFRIALEQGAQGLSVAFDLPTQRGYDSDAPHVAADVGMAGVAIDTVEDMARLFAGVPLDKVSVSMTMNGAVLPIMAAFIVAAEEAGVSPNQLRGTIQNDILKEFMVRNTWIFAPEPSLRIAADVVEFLSDHVPRFNSLSVSGYHLHEAGADAVLELALTFANARQYVRSLSARGVSVNAVCERISFFFGIGTDFFVEIAKLRAARLIWSTVAHALGATTGKARALRMHCQTSGWTLSARQPENNIVRTTVEAMAAVFGGTQSLHTNAYDEALALPSVETARLARDTQLILQHEMGLCDVVDPWAGSYMMESLTDDIAQRVRALIDEIDSQGGVIEAISSGWVQRRIHERALQTQAKIDGKKRLIVGVNHFVAEDGEERDACFVVDGRRVRGQQASRIADVKRRRDETQVRRSLDALTQAARDGVGNLLALTINCMRARATVGECTAALEAVWPRFEMPLDAALGCYAQERVGDPAWRAACERVDQLRQKIGRSPRVLVAKLGQDGHDRGAKVVAAALADAGFQVALGPLFASPQAVVDEAIASQSDVIGISALAGAHLALVPQVLEELRRRGAHVAVLVGGIIPVEHAVTLKAQGVAEVFGPGTPLDSIVMAIAGAVQRPSQATDSTAPHRMSRRPATGALIQ
jgi:methylmalonyl-CoA mutase